MIRLLSYIFPQIVFTRADNQPQIFLTFDDGPHPIFTAEILDILNAYHVQATFFLVGKSAESHPDLVYRIFQEGHTIGNHSYSHHKMVFRSGAWMKDEILRTQQILSAITNTMPQLFRPPFGYFAPGLVRTCQQLDLTMVLWSIMTYDFRPDFNDEQIIDNIARRSTNGTILLLHDGHDHSARTVKILPQIINIFLKNGHTLTSL